MSLPSLNIDTDKEATCSANGEFTFITPVVVMTGMTDDPLNPPASYDDFDGTYQICTAALCPTDVTGSSTDENGYLTLNRGSTVRYVWQNENGAKLAINNIDNVMNLYLPGVDIGDGQGSRSGYTWGYSNVYISFPGSGGNLLSLCSRFSS